MRRLENFSLKTYNTFGLDVSAREVYIAGSTGDIHEFLQNHHNPSHRFMVLGGGSNVLFSRNFDGCVLIIASKGISVEELPQYYIVRAAAGENWEEFTDFCVEHALHGLENLALIPGSVGASPIQNIGAYGVEVKEYIHAVEAVDRQSGQIRVFAPEECAFGYRSSIFKTSLRGKYIISAVHFRLSKSFIPHLSYGALAAEFSDKPSPTHRELADAVKRIRRSKLPDHRETGNAGSFFKNPVVEKAHYELLLQKYPEMVAYPATEGIKLAAGWLIEQAGWKGKVLGNAAVHHKQALVLINRGNAGGEEILSLAAEIQKSVRQKFGIALEPEVNIIE